MRRPATRPAHRSTASDIGGPGICLVVLDVPRTLRRRHGIGVPGWALSSKLAITRSKRRRTSRWRLRVREDVELVVEDSPNGAGTDVVRTHPGGVWSLPRDDAKLSGEGYATAATIETPMPC